MSSNRDFQGSSDRFGYQWHKYSNIDPESRVHLQRWLGPVELSSFSGKTVLDVGCGMGRNPFWILQEGASSLVGIDIDDRSLAAARENLAGFSNAKVMNLSVYDLPESNLENFEVVVNIGVLHHLADRVLALHNLWAKVAPGGMLVVWVYGREGNKLIIPMIRLAQFFGSRLPLRLVHVMAKIAAAFVWLGIRCLPIQTEYYQYIRRLSLKNLALIVFDQMIPRIACYWSEAEIKDLFSTIQATDISFHFVQGNSWTIVAKKSGRG